MKYFSLEINTLARAIEYQHVSQQVFSLYSRPTTL